MLTVIKGNKQENDEKRLKRENFLTEKYESLLRKHMLDFADTMAVLSLHKSVYYGIKYINSVDKRVRKRDENLKGLYRVTCVLMAYIGLLTPRDLLAIFPLGKKYDGHKDGWKDYVTSMEAVEEYGIDTVLGEYAPMFLMDYINHDVFTFNVVCVSIASEIVKQQTGQGLFDSFMDSIGEHLPHYDEVVNPATGTKFMRNFDTGEMLTVEKPKSNHMKLV